MGYYYQGWGVSIRDGVLVNGMWCYLPGWVVLNGMGCYFPGWLVKIRDGVFVNGIGC